MESSMCTAVLSQPPTAVAASASPLRSDTVAPTLVDAGPCRVTTLTDDLQPEYDRFVNAHRAGTLFHTTAWLDAVRGAFPHQPMHLLATRTGEAPSGRRLPDRIVGALPLFLVRSRFAGRMLVSVPYAVAGGILADDPDVAAQLFDAAVALARRERATCIDLRSAQPAIPSLPVDDRYVTFERTLPERADDVLEWLPRKARAAARNGRDKFHLTFETGPEFLPDVWQLYTENMRRLASIAYPLRFFRALHSAHRDRTWVSIARWNDRPVAGLVSFLFRDRVSPYFFGCTHAARRCSAANYLYFRTMQRAVEYGLRIFDFGRSRRDNPGSFDFKRFHGFEPTPLHYQKYLAPGTPPPDLSPTSRRFRAARSIWPLLPLRMTQWAGSYLSQHIPG